MKKVYLVNQESDDYDMIENIVVVANDEIEALELAMQRLKNYIYYDKNNEFPIIITEIKQDESKIICSF